MDSNSSDDSIEDEPPTASENDKKFMEEALKVAKLSPDPHKQVILCGLHSTCRPEDVNYVAIKINVTVVSYRFYVHVHTQYVGGSSCGRHKNREDTWTWVE